MISIVFCWQLNPSFRILFEKNPTRRLNTFGGATPVQHGLRHTDHKLIVPDSRPSTLFPGPSHIFRIFPIGSIQWCRETITVLPQRIYMVGWSSPRYLKTWATKTIAVLCGIYLVGYSSPGCLKTGCTLPR